LRIDGHTDATPVRHSRYRSNWELSAARASAVAEYLEGAGIPARRLMVAGLADTAPVAAGKDEDSRRKNRRIELRLTGG
jgi:chemotaxis protein MotB